MIYKMLHYQPEPTENRECTRVLWKAYSSFSIYDVRRFNFYYKSKSHKKEFLQKLFHIFRRNKV